MENNRGTALMELLIVIPFLIITISGTLLSVKLLEGKMETLWSTFRVNIISGRSGRAVKDLLSESHREFSRIKKIEESHKSFKGFPRLVPQLPPWDRELEVTREGKRKYSRLPLLSFNVNFSEKNRVAVNCWDRNSKEGKKIWTAIVTPLHLTLLSLLWR